MIIYFVLLFLLFLLSIWHLDKNNLFFKILWFLIVLLLVLFIGLRYQVGGDWVTYNIFFKNYLEQDINFNLSTEPFFKLFYKYIGSIGLNIYIANLISAILLMTSLSLLLLKEKYPFTGLFLSFPVLLVIVGMGFNRQSIALSIIIFGFLFWKRSFLRYSFFIILASLFHKSAILMVLINRFNLKFINILPLITTMFGIFLVFFFLSNHINNIIKGYPLFEIKSYFSYIRVIYILLPSLIFLIYKKNFHIYSDYLFISKYSTFSLILIPVLILNADIATRLSFYFLPLSIIILSRLPMMFNNLNMRISLIIIIHILTICYFIFFIFYANNVNGWVPYNNILIK